MRLYTQTSKRNSTLSKLFLRRSCAGLTWQGGAVGIQPFFYFFGQRRLPLGTGKFQGLLGRGYGLVSLVQTGISRSQIQISFDKIRFQTQDLLIMFDGLLNFTCSHKQDAQVVVDLRNNPVSTAGPAGKIPLPLVAGLFRSIRRQGCSVPRGNLVSAAGPPANVLPPLSAGPFWIINCPGCCEPRENRD